MYGAPSLRQLVPAAVLIVLGFALANMLPTYFVYLANLLLTYAILAIGLDILIGWTGQFAFAHIAFFGIGAYTTALFQVRLGLPFLAGISAGAIIAASVSVLIAVPATRLRATYLALATIAFAETARWLCNSWTDVTNGPDGVRISPPHIFGYIIDSDARALPIIAMIAAATIAATQYLVRSKLGRSLTAVRESEHLATVSGINARRVKILAFALSAVYASIAGGVYTLFQSFINPDVFGINQLIFVLSMIIIGGSGSIVGVLIGVATIGVLPEVMRSAMSNILVWQELVYGFILLACMMYMPQGIGAC